MKIKTTKEEINIKEARLKELRDIRESNLKRKEEIYIKYLEELGIVIDYIKEKKYYFSHPDFDEVAIGGPILGKDNKKGILYIYDVDYGWVKGFDLYNTKLEPKRTSLYGYFSEYDFEIAMKGLLSLINFQDEAIETLENHNKETEKIIEKYEEIIT